MPLNALMLSAAQQVRIQMPTDWKQWYSFNFWITNLPMFGFHSSSHALLHCRIYLMSIRPSPSLLKRFTLSYSSAGKFIGLKLFTEKYVDMIFYVCMVIE